jgi:hypothetical protein
MSRFGQGRGRVSGHLRSKRSGGEAANTPQQSEAATSDAQRNTGLAPVATALCCRVRVACPRAARLRDMAAPPRSRLSRVRRLHRTHSATRTLCACSNGTPLPCSPHRAQRARNREMRLAATGGGTSPRCPAFGAAGATRRFTIAITMRDAWSVVSTMRTPASVRRREFRRKL